MRTIKLNIWWNYHWTYTINDFMAYIDSIFEIASFKKIQLNNYDIFITCSSDTDHNSLIKDIKENFPGDVKVTYIGNIL